MTRQAGEQRPHPGELAPIDEFRPWLPKMDSSLSLHLQHGLAPRTSPAEWGTHSLGTRRCSCAPSTLETDHDASSAALIRVSFDESTIRELAQRQQYARYSLSTGTALCSCDRPANDTAADNEMASRKRHSASRPGASSMSPDRPQGPDIPGRARLDPYLTRATCQAWNAAKAGSNATCWMTSSWDLVEGSGRRAPIMVQMGQEAKRGGRLGGSN
ncbi:hypothetical protein CDD80_2256 [Ophiocordyceps camponoti-rufipedis]|uniref:Uncharacterized protein n=1 Tax=Ophiocordyceps camponoti-rufipedis TaxID=2004952 RepID=A0A2C5Z191_9HYPO|nr:hypothetical protein CDD80_2256 [Ophiocordyceps camponoti-rufipedis]